jgi:hypothetical protein
MNPPSPAGYDEHSLANLTAYERVQLDPFYFQRSAQATIRKISKQYANPDFRPMNFTEATIQFEGPDRTIRTPKKQELRQVRNGQMPANFWAPPSTIRKFGLDPAEQIHNAPTRRRRWRNEPTGFVLPPMELEAIPGHKRVLKWQDYEQDRVKASLMLKKQPIAFGHPAHGYTRVPIEYRKLTPEEQRDPFAHTRFENQY